MDVTLYHDPFEYPDWRWSRVKSLITDGKAPTAQDDKYVHRGYRFAKAVEDCDGSDTARYSISLEHKDMARAVGLFNNLSNRKYYLEALILCQDVGENEIAEYLGLTPNTVRYYFKLFFDVRNYLSNPGYVCSRILEPAVMQSLADCKDPNIAWKIAGLFGGYEAVKACWELKDASPKVKQYYKSAGMTALLKDFGVGTHLRPLTKWNTEAVAEHILKFAEIEVKTAALRGSQQSEEKVDMLRDIMSSIKFFVVNPNAPVNPREPRLFEKVDQSLVATVCGE